MFGTILISVCTLMHIYVFWRIASVPFVNRHVPLYLLIVTGVLLWAIFFIGRQFHHSGTGTLVATVELFGMLWMGTLFLLFIPLLAMDIISGFGFSNAAAGAFTSGLGFVRRRGVFRNCPFSGLAASGSAKL